MSYIVRYTTLSGKQITMPHRIFESAKSAKAHGEQRVSEGNYRSYTVVEAKEGDKIKYRNIKSKRTKTGTVKKVDTKNGQTRYELEGGKYVYDSDLEEGYKILPPMDREKYQERPGLEGPFRTLSGKVIYYDPREGSYYDPDTDMYLSYDEFQQLDNDYSNMKDERDIPVREGKNAADHRQGLVDKIKKSGVVKSGSMSKEQKKPKKSRVNEAYVKTSKDAINALGALRKIGKHIETGQNTYDGNLANQFANDVYDVISWVENNLDTNDPKYTQILAPVIELRKKAKSMEREPGSGKNARFGNEIVNTLYPLMSWIQNNAVGMNEAVAKIACTKCDEVSTAKAWQKNGGFCPKCKTSSQGVAESAITEGDIVDFSSYAGMYSDGAHASFSDRDGNMHTISATGDRPRKYYIDGEEVSWKDAKRIVGNQKLQPQQGMNEGLSDDAHHMERDHEVQMARSELYKTANYAIKLHSILKGISEEQGLEGWMQAKITKAADYLSSVFHALEYDEMERGQGNLKMPMGESRDPADAFAREQGSSGAAAASGTVKKIKTKDGKHEAWWAKNNSGTMKTFRSEKAARKFARSSDVGETTTAGGINEAKETYTGRETKDGTWRVFQSGKAAAVAGPFKSKQEAAEWIKKQKQGSTRKSTNETTTAGAVASAPMPMGKTIKRRKK